MYAVVAASIASLVRVLVAFFLGWIPFLGPLLALVASVAVIDWRCPEGWLSALAIALIARVASLAILYVFSVVGLAAFDAVGVPGA